MTGTGSWRLSTRVVAAVSVLTLVVLTSGGLLLRAAVRDTLVERAASELRLAVGNAGPGTAGAPSTPGLPGAAPPPGQPPGSPTATATDGGRTLFGVVEVTTTGEVLRNDPARDVNGVAVPAPDIDELLALPVTQLPDPPAITELVGTDRTSAQLVAAVTTPRGTTLVRTMPLAEVDAAVADVTRLLALVGLASMTVLLAGLWFAVRRELAPLAGVSKAATQIAGGDLSARTQLSSGPSDIVALGEAFDDMATQLAADAASRDATEQRLRDFVADASHELRTPLTALQGHAGLFRLGALDDPEKLAKSMTRINEQTERMSRLVDDLLDMARADEASAARRPVELAALVQGIAADVRAVEPDRPLEVSVPTTLTITGSEEQLTRVVENLVGNARKHTPTGTPIRISLLDTGDEVCLAVEDDGPGMSSEERVRAFDRFWRADRSRARAEGSSGLGLAIVHAIVIGHRGTIEVTEAASGGTRFEVMLPRHAT